MINYKGFNIWFNEIQNKWLIQTGYHVIKSYSSLSSAKRWVTNEIKREA